MRCFVTRADQPGYDKYIDGVGNTQSATRAEFYCRACKLHFQQRNSSAPRAKTKKLKKLKKLKKQKKQKQKNPDYMVKIAEQQQPPRQSQPRMKTFCACHGVRCELGDGKQCCACADSRPFSHRYMKYVDGVGDTPAATRSEAYCPSCASHFRLHPETKIEINRKVNAIASYMKPSAGPSTVVSKSKEGKDSKKQTFCARHGVRCELGDGKQCCACADSRPFSHRYMKYVDGVGDTPAATRSEAYCPSCASHFQLHPESNGETDGPIEETARVQRGAVEAPMRHLEQCETRRRRKQAKRQRRRDRRAKATTGHDSDDEFETLYRELLPLWEHQEKHRKQPHLGIMHRYDQEQRRKQCAEVTARAIRSKEADEYRARRRAERAAMIRKLQEEEIEEELAREREFADNIHQWADRLSSL